MRGEKDERGIRSKLEGGGKYCTNSDSSISRLVLAQAKGEGESQTLSRHLGRETASCEQTILPHVANNQFRCYAVKKKRKVKRPEAAAWV